MVTNEIPGSAEKFIQARIEGKSWQQIAEEFDLPNPSAARKAFEKATGIGDFKIKGQALANLVKQGPDALKAVNQAKLAAKKVKGLDDVVPKKPPAAAIDLSKHDLDWPEPKAETVKNKLNMNVGYTDKQFDNMLSDFKDGVSKMDIMDEYALKNKEWNDLLDVWYDEGKLGNAEDFLSKKFGYDDKDIAQILKDYKGGANKQDISDIWSLSTKELDNLVDYWTAQGKLGKVAQVADAIDADPYDAFKGKWEIADNDDVMAHVSSPYDYADDPRFTKQTFKPDELLAGQDVPIDMDYVDKLAQNPIKWNPDEPVIVARINGKNVVIDGHNRAIAAAKRGDLIDAYFIDVKDHIVNLPKVFLKPKALSKMEQAVAKAKAAGDTGGIGGNPFNYKPISESLMDELDPDQLDKLWANLVKEKNDTLYNLNYDKQKAKQKYLDYLDKYENTPQWSDAAISKLSDAHQAAIKALNTYTDGPLKLLDADIDKVKKIIGGKPVKIPDIPVNKPVQSDFASDVTTAQKTGLTNAQVNEIISLNNEGKGYLAIKDKLGVDFAQIDEVVWNDLLKRNNGFTWKAYVDKPTSENGFNAVKSKVFEARSKGLTIDEIIAKPGAPPKGVVQAILDDKWKLPEAGAKAPIIPPPPPPPPQVFGGVFPSSGTNFRRHTDTELLDWIRPDTSTLSSHQRGAISNYTNSGYTDINGYLRGGQLTDTSGYGYNGKNVVNQVKRIDETMRPIPVDVTLTRNFHGVHHLPAKPEDMVGKVFWDDAYLSTSISEAGVFSGDVQLIINARAGTMGRYVNDISSHKSEYEMLLARGVRMVVTKVEKTAHGGGFRYRLYVDTIV